MKKILSTYTVECYSTIKQNEILLFSTTLMDLEGIMLSEMSKKDKYSVITYMCNLKTKTNVYNKTGSQI